MSDYSTNSRHLRVGYFSSELIIHDDRFLEKLSVSHDETYLFTIRKTIPEHLLRIPRVKVFNLYQPLFPYDDPADPSYGFKTRLRIKVGFLYYAWKLRKLLAELKPDILHAGWVPTDGYIAAMTGYHPFLLMPWYGDIVHTPFDWPSSQRRVIRALESADAITCDADIIFEKMKVLSPDTVDKKLLQFPWGIDLQKFFPAESSRRPNETLEVVCVKFIRERAGFDLLVKAMGLLKERGVAVRVHVYGDGNILNTYRYETRLRGLEAMLVWHGYVDNDQIPERLRAADVYLSTSLGDGTSLALMEAMACGLALVVTDIPAHHQWIESGVNGFIFGQRDAEGLARQLEQLAVNKSDLRRMGAKNAEIARREFDWDVNFEKLEKLYFEMLASKRAEK